MSKVLIIDFLNMYFRNFAVVNTSSYKDGEHNGGLYGTLRSIKSEIKRFDPDRLIVVCDGSGGSIRRRKLFEDYKSGRKVPRFINKNYGFESIEKQQEALNNQFRRLVEYVKSLPITYIQLDNIEADDTIAYLSTLEKNKNNYTIVSTDKDFLQLVSKNCNVYNPQKKVLYTIDNFKEKWFGISPVNFVVARSLIGDGSDDIPGLYRMGFTTAVKVLPCIKEDHKYFINNIIDYCKKNVEKEKNKSVKNWLNIIISNEDLLKRNYKLMQLYDVDISLSSINEINSLYKQNIKQFSPFSIRKLFLQDSLFSLMKDFNEWASLFSKLSNKNEVIK